MRNLRGIALVLSLFLSAILALIALHIQGEAQSQVYQAQLLKDKSKAYLAVKNAKSKVLYYLLTSSINELKSRENWSFNGESIFIDDVKVGVQDINGLFNLYGYSEVKVFSGILAQCGVERGKAGSIAQLVLSSHTGNASHPLDKYQRLYALLGSKATQVMKQCINENVTRYVGRGFNPFTATYQHLVAALGQHNADEIEAETKSGLITQELYNRYTSDDPDDNQGGFIGPSYRLYFEGNAGEARWSEALEVKLQTSLIARPIQILSYKPRL